MANLNLFRINLYEDGMSLKNSAALLLLSIGFILISNTVSTATNFPLINSAYKYNPNAPIKCKYYLASSDDSVHVYLKIDISSGNLKEGYQVGYALKTDYGEKTLDTVDSLNIGNFLIGVKKSTYYLKIPLKVSPNSNLLLLNIAYGQQINYYFDIPLDLTDRFAPPNLVIKEKASGLPILESFVKAAEAFTIQQSFNSSAPIPLHFFQYNHDFTAAYPPMSSGTDPNKSLKIDSTFTLSPEDLAVFKDVNEALYFVQSDSTILRGLSFRVVPNWYPDFKRAEELISPLIYISTKNEMTRLFKSTETKKALDKYWLDLISNPGRARNIIKSYYDQVEIANAIFTTYKEGWKTDQGMVFMLYGPPDEVYFDGNEEQWLYKKNNDISRVKFTFVKIKNIFTNQHFELIRNKSYESFWFGNVELWRKGIKNL